MGADEVQEVMNSGERLPVEMLETGLLTEVPTGTLVFDGEKLVVVDGE